MHLLEALDPQKYTYAGEVELVGEPYPEKQLDDGRHVRNVWMFPLKLKENGRIPTPTEEQARTIEASQARIARRLPIAVLRARAKDAKTQPAQRLAKVTTYVRNAAVAEYAKRLADGVCDLCEQQAPFCNAQDEAYLECHHIVWLAQGGFDAIENTVALCPNCHRKMHVLNKSTDKAKLRQRAAKRAAN